MKTILIATDGSDHAGKALDIGAALAKKFGSRIIILHIMMRGASFDAVHKAFIAQGLSTDILDELLKDQMPTFAYGMGGPIPPIVPLIELGRLGQRILDRAKKTLTDEGIEDAKFLMEDGDAAEKIVDIAKRENADVIVLGHRGLGTVGEVFAGSVSTKVGHRAACTVISVK